MQGDDSCIFIFIIYYKLLLASCAIKSRLNCLTSWHLYQNISQNILQTFKRAFCINNQHNKDENTSHTLIRHKEIQATRLRVKNNEKRVSTYWNRSISLAVFPLAVIYCFFVEGKWRLSWDKQKLSTRLPNWISPDTRKANKSAFPSRTEWENAKLIDVVRRHEVVSQLTPPERGKEKKNLKGREGETRSTNKSSV